MHPSDIPQCTVQNRNVPSPLWTVHRGTLPRHHLGALLVQVVSTNHPLREAASGAPAEGECQFNTIDPWLPNRAHMPSWPSTSGSAHGQKVWNLRGLIGLSRNDTPFFPYKWNKTKVSHLVFMSIQLIHDWSSIKHTDYSYPVLWECHHQASMADRRPDFENNPGSNQINISPTQLN